MPEVVPPKLVNLKILLVSVFAEMSHQAVKLGLWHGVGCGPDARLWQDGFTLKGDTL